MRRTQRPVLTAFGAAGVVFVACHVYDPSDLVGPPVGASAGVPSGGGAGGSGLGGLGSGTGGALPAGGLGGDQNLAGDSGFEGGAAGEDGSGGTGGSVAAMGGSGGKGTGASGGSVGAGRGGAAAYGGAGSGGVGTGGTAGVSGGAGSGDAGTGGTAGASAGGAGAGGSAGSSGTSGSGAGGSPEVELTGTATADSYENTSGKMHPPEHGNDADLATRWCAANANAGHYWTLDLGASHTLTHFEVDWEYPSQAIGLAYLYIVGVSDDGTTFTTVIDQSANTDTMSTQRSDFPASTTGRYVRITVTGLPNGTTWASFWEARVFGT